MNELLAASVIFFLGVWWWFFQQDLERMRRLHAEDGIDSVITDIEYALGIYQQNWQMSLRALKLFRDTPQILTTDHAKAYTEVDHSRLSIGPSRRIAQLVGSTSVWIVYQRAFTFSGVASQQIIAEVTPVFMSNLTSDNDTRLEICDLVEKTMRDFDRDYHGLITLTNYLYEIKDEIDNERIMSRRKIKKFRDRDNIKSMVTKIEEVTDAWVEKLKDEEAPNA